MIRFMRIDQFSNHFDRKIHLMNAIKQNLCKVSLENGFMVSEMQCVLLISSQI